MDLSSFFFRSWFLIRGFFFKRKLLGWIKIHRLLLLHAILTQQFRQIAELCVRNERNHIILWTFKVVFLRCDRVCVCVLVWARTHAHQICVWKHFLYVIINIFVDWMESVYAIQCGWFTLWNCELAERNERMALNWRGFSARGQESYEQMDQFCFCYILFFELNKSNYVHKFCNPFYRWSVCINLCNVRNIRKIHITMVILHYSYTFDPISSHNKCTLNTFYIMWNVKKIDLHLTSSLHRAQALFSPSTQENEEKK